MIFAERLFSGKKGEFATLMIRDCIRREPKIQSTETFVRMQVSDMGALFTGTVEA